MHRLSGLKLHLEGLGSLDGWNQVLGSFLPLTIWEKKKEKKGKMNLILIVITFF